MNYVEKSYSYSKLGDEFEIEYISGNHDFYYFKDWFNGEEKTKTPIDWSELGYGDFIHVEEGLNVIALGDIYKGKFVGTSNNGTYVYELTSESRPCDELEIEEVENSLKEKGISYCYDNVDFIPNPTPASFQSRFEDLCLEKAVTHYKVANDCLFDKSNISRWFSKGFLPELEILELLCDYFNVSPDYLLGRTEDKD